MAVQKAKIFVRLEGQKKSEYIISTGRQIHPIETKDRNEKKRINLDVFPVDKKRKERKKSKNCSTALQ